jgi:hypothetical protein
LLLQIEKRDLSLTKQIRGEEGVAEVTEVTRRCDNRHFNG